MASIIINMGHECCLFDATFVEDGPLCREFVDFASRTSCDAIFVHCTSADWWLVKVLLTELHVNLPAYRPVTIIGGQHATIVPDEVASSPFITGLVIGEGELVVRELLTNIERDRDLSSISNCWIKTKRGLFRNKVRPLIEDLDTLPLPYWDLFDDKHRMRFSKELNVLDVHPVNIETSRGCPYSCTFCMNSSVRKLYKGMGKYYRSKSASRVISEAIIAKNRVGSNFIQIVDDNFLDSLDRLKELSQRFPSEVGLPVSLQASADKINESTIRLLKDMGTEILAIGIETGNEIYRKRILRKKVSDEQIIRAIHLARDHEIGTMAYYMIGLPFEKKEYIEQTIAFNNLAQPDICVVSTYYPFPGTLLFDAAREKQLIKDAEFGLDFFHESTLLLEQLTIADLDEMRSQFKNAARFFGPLPRRDRMRILQGSSSRYSHITGLDCEG